MRKEWIWVSCLMLFLMVGCASHPYFGVPSRALYVPPEFAQTETAIANAEKSEGAKYCPDKIAQAKDLAKQGVETYWACYTAKSMEMLAQARQMAKDAESCQPPPAPVAVAPAPPPAPKELTFEHVYFDFDKAALTPTAVGVLNRNLKLLQDNPSVVVELWGHTDSKGSVAYNQKLSQARANAVKNWLVTHGIAPERIRTEGFGKTKPRENNQTDEGRAMNRRVGFHVISQ